MLLNTKQDRIRLCNELDTLVEILDEHIDTFCQRIEFIQKGEHGKARFIDEKVLPTIDRRLQDQVSKIEKKISMEGANYESKEG